MPESYLAELREFIAYLTLVKINKSENQNIEFKQSWRDEYLKWIQGRTWDSIPVPYVKVEDLDKGSLDVSSEKYIELAKRFFNVEKFAEQNDPVKLIFDILRNNPMATYSEISTQIKKSEATVKRAISKLKKKGLIKRNGSDKLGYWQVMEK